LNLVKLKPPVVVKSGARQRGQRRRQHDKRHGGDPALREPAAKDHRDREQRAKCQRLHKIKAELARGQKGQVGQDGAKENIVAHGTPVTGPGGSGTES